MGRGRGPSPSRVGQTVRMDNSSWASVVALVFSAAALIGQGISSFRHRRRVAVVAQIVSSSSQFDGFVARFTVSVKVSAIGHSAGIERIMLETEDKVTDISISLAGPKPFYWDPPKKHDVTDIFGARRVLVEGEVAAWEFRVQRPENNPDGVDQPYVMRAVVTLASGKVHKSSKFTLPPDRSAPPEL